MQQLRGQYGTARSTADGVVRERDKPPVEHCIWPQAANRHGHAVAGIAIELGLWPRRLLVINEERLGRARQRELLRLAAEVAPCGEDLLARRLLLERDEHRGHVAV